MFKKIIISSIVIFFICTVFIGYITKKDCTLSEWSECSNKIQTRKINSKSFFGSDCIDKTLTKSCLLPTPSVEPVTKPTVIPDTTPTLVPVTKPTVIPDTTPTLVPVSGSFSYIKYPDLFIDNYPYSLTVPDTCYRDKETPEQLAEICNRIPACKSFSHIPPNSVWGENGGGCLNSTGNTSLARQVYGSNLWVKP